LNIIFHNFPQGFQSFASHFWNNKEIENDIKSHDNQQKYLTNRKPKRRRYTREYNLQAKNEEQRHSNKDRNKSFDDLDRKVDFDSFVVKKSEKSRTVRKLQR